MEQTARFELMINLKTGRSAEQIHSRDERHVAVLGEAAAASLGKKLGDELELLGETFRVIGIANYTTIVNRGIVLVPLIDLQEASYRTRQVTMIHVNVDGSGGAAELSRVRTSIEALGNLTASTTNEVLNNDRNFAISRRCRWRYRSSH